MNDWFWLSLLFLAPGPPQWLYAPSFSILMEWLSGGESMLEVTARTFRGLVHFHKSSGRSTDPAGSGGNEPDRRTVRAHLVNAAARDYFTRAYLNYGFSAGARRADCANWRVLRESAARAAMQRWGNVTGFMREVDDLLSRTRHGWTPGCWRLTGSTQYSQHWRLVRSSGTGRSGQPCQGGSSIPSSSRSRWQSPLARDSWSRMPPCSFIQARACGFPRQYPALSPAPR